MSITCQQVDDARGKTILASVFADPSILDRIAWLNPDAFHDARDSAVFATARTLYQNGQPCELVAVADYIGKHGDLTEHLGLDWQPYLFGLVSGEASTDPEFYARQLQEEHHRRHLKLAIDAGRIALDDPSVDPASVLHRITEVANRGTTTGDIPAMSSAELDAGRFDQPYLVEDVLAARQDCVFGAPKKCLKTNVSIDLNLSLASGSRFLNKFYVPRAVRAALISGESGRATIQETARRIARAKPWVNLSDYENAVWSFDLPQLSDYASLAALRRFIRRHRLEVVILDPAYLMLAIGDDAANLFKTGPLLRLLTKLGEDEGCTIIVVHHLKKDVAVTSGPPELEGIAWAGFQEWARQWLLMSRRAPYDTDRIGHHELWFTSGGSAGHSVGKALDIEEGDRRDTGGRRWQVEVLPIGEAIEAKVEAATTAKEQRQQAREAKEAEATAVTVLHALEGKTDGLTARRFKDEYGIRSPKLMPALRKLIDAGTVKECEVVAANKQTYQGWKLSKYLADNTGQHRALVQCGPVLPGDTGPHTGQHSPLIGELPGVCVARRK
ncbi:MAG: AAA family ATPase [Planctomycetaceae bacterium]|nr:AAA family ATPase [Planctomycetaceae bacterium]